MTTATMAETERRRLPKALRRFTKSFNAMLGLTLTLLLVLVALFAPLLVQEDPYQIDFSKLSQRLEPPGETTLLGPTTSVVTCSRASSPAPGSVWRSAQVPCWSDCCSAASSGCWPVTSAAGWTR